MDSPPHTRNMARKARRQPSTPAGTTVPPPVPLSSQARTPARQAQRTISFAQAVTSAGRAPAEGTLDFITTETLETRLQSLEARLTDQMKSSLAQLEAKMEEKMEAMLEAMLERVLEATQQTNSKQGESKVGRSHAPPTPQLQTIKGGAAPVRVPVQPSAAVDDATSELSDDARPKDFIYREFKHSGKPPVMPPVAPPVDRETLLRWRTDHSVYLTKCEQFPCVAAPKLSAFTPDALDELRGLMNLRITDPVSETQLDQLIDELRKETSELDEETRVGDLEAYLAKEFKPQSYRDARRANHGVIYQSGPLPRAEPADEVHRG